jgi:hypothetical protein
MGMIQDMQNPELFLEQYEVQDNVSRQTTVKMGKYRDIPTCGVSVGNIVTCNLYIGLHFLVFFSVVVVVFGL